MPKIKIRPFRRKACPTATASWASLNSVSRIALGFGMAALMMATVSAEGAKNSAPINNASVNRTASIRIELLPNVAVHHAQVTLGEIAHVSTQDLSTLQRLNALSLGSIARTGAAVHLDREMLARWMRTRLGIETVEISWSGSNASDIHFVVGELAGERIARHAVQALQATFTKKSMRADIGVSQTPRDITVPTGAIELRVRRFSETSLMAKHQSAWVDIWVEGSFFRTVPVGLEVSVFAPAYVVTQNLSEGQTVDPAAFAVREVEWSGRASLPLSVADENAALSVGGRAAQALRLRRPVHAGETLTRAGVEAAPLVARGDYATLRTIQGAIELESRVEVLQDGSAGQAVRVKLPNASSAIIARVSGPGAVEVRQ